MNYLISHILLKNTLILLVFKVAGKFMYITRSKANFPTLQMFYCNFQNIYRTIIPEFNTRKKFFKKEIKGSNRILCFQIKNQGKLWASQTIPHLTLLYLELYHIFFYIESFSFYGCSKIKVPNLFESEFSCTRLL